MSDRYLIVGLGNKGRQYEHNRHNAGWMVLDEVARRYGLTFDKTERKALTASGMMKGKRVLLAKPQTYMNASGEAVRGLMDFYRIEPDALLLISDDLDIPLGTLRLRQQGGPGGQNGIRSVIQHLGTRDFGRVRFGIGRPPGRMDPAAYVLQDFRNDEMDTVRQVIDTAANAVEEWLSAGIEAAMTRYNGDVEQQKASAASTVDPEAQLALYQRAHELDPRNPGPVEQMIGVLKRTGRIDEAIEWHLRLADILYDAGKPAKALEQQERAVNLKPSLIALQRQVAEGYQQQGNNRRAVQRLVSLAEYLHAEGRVNEALAVLHDALAINPSHPKALALHSRYSQ